MKKKIPESFSDYPKGAKNNAKRAIAWAEENGWGSCGTGVGKQRAHQLAKGEALSWKTVKRMAAFRRHQKNKDTPYGDGCGGLMWDAWGGDSGVRWAETTVKKYSDKKNFAIEIMDNVVQMFNNKK